MKASTLPSISKEEIDRLLALYESEMVDDADNRLRQYTERIWATLTKEERAELAGMSLKQLEAFVPEPKSIGPDTKATLGIEEDVRKGLYDRLGVDVSTFEGAAAI